MEFCGVNMSLLRSSETVNCDFLLQTYRSCGAHIRIKLHFSDNCDFSRSKQYRQLININNPEAIKNLDI